MVFYYCPVAGRVRLLNLEVIVKLVRYYWLGKSYAKKEKSQEEQKI